MVPRPVWDALLRSKMSLSGFLTLETFNVVDDRLVFRLTRMK